MIVSDDGIVKEKKKTDMLICNQENHQQSTDLID